MHKSKNPAFVYNHNTYFPTMLRLLRLLRLLRIRSLHFPTSLPSVASPENFDFPTSLPSVVSPENFDFHTSLPSVVSPENFDFEVPPKTLSGFLIFLRVSMWSPLQKISTRRSAL